MNVQMRIVTDNPTYRQLVERVEVLNRTGLHPDAFRSIVYGRGGLIDQAFPELTDRLEFIRSTSGQLVLKYYNESVRADQID